MDLTEFIAARLDEDEATAKAALESVRGQEGELAQAAGPCISEAGYLHIARHDPARVLREVEAKWRILDDYRITVNACRRVTGAELDTPGYRSMCAGRDAFRSACVTLAAVWSDHPDYDTAWSA